MKKQKGNSGLMTIIVAVVVLLGIFYFLGKKAANGPMNYGQPTVSSGNDLTSASNDLDATNVDEMDADLGGLSTDSSSF